MRVVYSWKNHTSLWCFGCYLLSIKELLTKTLENPPPATTNLISRVCYLHGSTNSSDIVEKVPASVSKRSLQDRQSYEAHFIFPEDLKGVHRLQPVIVTCNNCQETFQ